MAYQEEHHGNQKLFPFSRPTSPVHSPENRVVGFIGIGTMGFFMARNLAKTLPNQMRVWNRTASKAEPLVKELGSEKIHIDKTIEELVEASDVIITSVANDGAVEAVFKQIHATIEKLKSSTPKILIETSTILPGTMVTLHKLFEDIPRVKVLACVIFGAAPAADAAKLVIVLGGDAKAKKDAAYLFVPAWGRKIVDMGEEIEKVKGLKLIGNSVILGTIELLAENFVLAEKSNVGAGKLAEVLEELMPAVPVQGYSKKILEQKFDGSVGFELTNGIKDAGHMRNFAAQYSCSLPTIDLAYQHLQTAKALQTSSLTSGSVPFKNLDWSSLAVAPRIAAGLPAFEKPKN